MDIKNYKNINADILYSILNTKLRDEFESLDDLCDYFDISKEEITSYLKKSNYFYHEDIKQFRKI